MADIESNIRIDIDTSSALASIKALQSQISQFQKEMSAASAATAANARNLQRQLVQDINATGQFSAGFRTIRSTTESFTNALEKNKLSMGEYFRFGASQVKGFRNVFASEFETIEKTARERVKTLQTQYISLGRDANGALQSIAVRPLSLDMNNLGTQTAMVAQRQQIFNQLLKQGSTNLLNFGKNTQWAGRQLMVGFTIPLSIFGNMAAKTFMDLERQAIRFKRVYGDAFSTDQETDVALENMKRLASEFTKYGIEIEKTLQLAADAAQMGLKGEELRAQVSEATRLAVLGEVEQQEALETTISVTNAFGIAAEDLASKIDFLNAVENETMTAISDLTIAIPKAAPVVKQLGGDVEDLAFFLTAMKEGGINASEGANALKSGLASLINPTGEASRMLQGFGINIQEIVNANKGDVSGLVVEFATALDKLDPLDRARAIEQLFGKFQFARISTLFQNVISEGTQAQRVLELANATTSELAQLSSRELGRIEESTTFKFQKAIEDFRAAIAPVGEEFLKLITPLVEIGTKILQNFNNMSDGAKAFVTGLIGILGGIAPIFLMTFGLIANGVANIIKGFAAVRNVFLNLRNGSKTLGEQIQYMTQEQLEAAAVAASLNQSHMNLAQTFTAEATAVQNLVNAYQKMIASQSKLMNRPIPTTIGKAGKTPGFAEGGLIKGPGSGTSDSIAAMVSNGEFIVSAKRTKQYLPLLEAIASGQVPGYASKKTGGSIVGKREPVTLATFSQYENVFAHIGDPLRMSLQELADSLTAMGKKIPLDVQRKIDQGLGNISTKAYGGLGFETRQSFNDAMALKPGAPGVDPASFLQDWDSRGVDKWSKSIKIAGMEMEDVKGELELLDAHIAKQIKSAAALDESFVITDKVMEDFYGKAMKELGVKVKRLKSAFDKAEDVVTEVRGTTTQASLSKAGYRPDPARTGKFIDPEGRAGQDASRIIKLGGGERGKNEKGVLQSTKRSEIASILDEKSSKKKAKTAAKQEQNANQDERTSKKKNAAAKKAEQAAEKDLQTAKRSAAARKGWETRKARQSEQAATVIPGAAINAAGTPKTRMSLDRLNSSIMGASFALTSLAGAGSMMGGAIGEASQKIFAFSGVLFALMQVTQLLTQANIAELASKRFSIARSAAFGPKIGPQTAAQAATGFGAALSKATLFVTKFLGPIGIATIALGALGFGIKAIIDAQEKQKQKIEGLGNTANLTEKQLKSLGDLFNVTAKSVDFKSAFEQPAGTTEQISLTEQVLQTENFAEDFRDQIAAVASSSVEQAEIALKSLSVQLASSGFAADQVDAIIRAIATEAERRDLNLDFANIDISTADIAASASSVASEAIAQFEQALSQEGAIEIKIVGGEDASIFDAGNAIRDAAGTAKVFSDEALQAAQLLSGVYATSFSTLKAGFEQGIVSAQDFNSEVSTITSKLLGLENVGIVIPNLIEKLGLTGELTSLTSFEDQLLAIQGAAAGFNVSELVTQLASLRSQEEALATETGPEAARQLNLIKNLRQGIVGSIQAQATETENLRIAEENATLNTEAIDAQIDSNRDKLAVYKELTAAGVDQSEALEMANDETWRQVTLEAIQKGQLPELVRLRNEYNASIAALPASSAAASVALTTEIEKLEEQKAVYEWLIANGTTVIDARKILGDATLYAAAAEAMLADQAANVAAQVPIAAQEIWELGGRSYETGGKILNLAASTAVATNNFDSFLEQFERFKALDFEVGQLKGISNATSAATPEKTPIEEAIDALKKQRTEISNSVVAYDRLREAGFNISAAFEAAQDPILAAALATTKVGTEEWDKLLRLIRATNRETAAADLSKLIIGNEDQARMDRYTDTIRNGLEEAGYSAEVIDKVLEQIGDNPALLQQFAKDLKDGKVDAKEILEYLTSVEKLDLEIEIDPNQAVKDMEDQVYEALSDIDAAFAAMTGQIELDFVRGTNLSQSNVVSEELKALLKELKDNPDLKLTTTDFINLTELNTIISDAQDQLARLNFSIDDLEASLKDIEDQEKIINKTFDTRIEALDKISDINEDLARQQQSQLDIADALSRGDIAAAARAAEAARKEQADATLQKQRDRLEASREAALEGIRSASGQSRKEIEQEIKDLKDQIFEIEEKILEPAQRALEIATKQKQEAIDSLTYLGQNKLAWDAVKNGVDMAKISAEEYKQKIRDAIALINDLKAAWGSVTAPDLGLGGVPAGGGSPLAGAATDNTAKGAAITYTDIGNGQGQASTKFGASTPVNLGPERTISSGEVGYRAMRGESVEDVAKRLGVDPSRIRVPDMREGNRGGEFLYNNQLIYVAPESEQKPSGGSSASGSTGNSSAQFTGPAEGNVAFREADPKAFAAARIAEEEAKLASGKLGPGARAAAQAKIAAYSARLAMGGLVEGYRMGGLIPYKAAGGLFKSINTDTVPAMLTPGEFVVRKFAVQKYGADKLKSINNGTYKSGSVYNYSVNVNVKSDANPDQIARAVMTQIKQVDSMRLRGNRF